MGRGVGEAGADVGAEDGQLMEGLFQGSFMEERLGRCFRIDELYIFEETIGSVMRRVLVALVVAEGAVGFAEVGKLNVHFRRLVLLLLP